MYIKPCTKRRRLYPRCRRVSTNYPMWHPNRRQRLLYIPNRPQPMQRQEGRMVARTKEDRPTRHYPLYKNRRTLHQSTTANRRGDTKQSTRKHSQPRSRTTPQRTSPATTCRTRRQHFGRQSRQPRRPNLFHRHRRMQR